MGFGWQSQLAELDRAAFSGVGESQPPQRPTPVSQPFRHLSWKQAVGLNGSATAQGSPVGT